MKRFNFLLLCLLMGCGDLGSSSSENQNTNNQILNPEPVSCEITCFQNVETGEVSVRSICEGGFNTPSPASVEDCTSFIEQPVEESDEPA